MEIFFIDYHDPLFSIIILFLIIFIISFASYWWTVYKHKEEKNQIKNFIKKFESDRDLLEYKMVAENQNISLESIILIALLHERKGDYDKAIEIYLLLLERAKDKEEKNQIFTMLGKLYFKAGFLQRSETTFLEGIKISPRNKKALNYLIVIYEKLRKYDKAIEILNVLEELNVDIKKQRKYIEALDIISTAKSDYQTKKSKLLQICNENKIIQRVLFEFLGRNEKEIKFKEIENFDFYKLVDLIWYLPKERIYLGDVKNSALFEILSARGIIDKEKKSAVFELDLLICLNSSKENKKADLRFEYICKECKEVFPIFFYRCPNCYTFDSAQTIPMIVKKEDEKNKYIY